MWSWSGRRARSGRAGRPRGRGVERCWWGVRAAGALGLYLSKGDPLLVLRDLLGHSSVLTTEKYLRRLDTTRIYAAAYEHTGLGDGRVEDTAAEREAEFEFDGGTV